MVRHSRPPITQSIANEIPANDFDTYVYNLKHRYINAMED